MSIDTAVKRHSALHVLHRSVPLPDGTISQGDRQTLVALYSDILSASGGNVLSPTRFAADVSRNRFAADASRNRVKVGP